MSMGIILPRLARLSNGICRLGLARRACVWYFSGKRTKTIEDFRHGDDSAVGVFQCVHDGGLVRPSEVPDLESVEGGADQLADRVGGVLFSGAG
jgi:hypothetical protein